MSEQNFFTSVRFPVRPRVRITSYCNRRCQYCFAQDYLSAKREDLEIHLDVMEDIIKLCKDDGIRNIAWQGGEPLLHTKLNQLVELHRKYGMMVSLFSNGLVDKEKVLQLNGVVERVLLNCNEPSTYTPDEWQLLNDNIETFKDVLGKENVAIGINIYNKDMDTEFIVNLAKEHSIDEVRIDMTRPAPSHKNEFIDFSDVKEMFKLLKKTVIRLEEENVKTPHFDCPFPLCALSEEDREFAYKYIYDDMKYAMCRTGLDITTDAQLASCFCSVPIKDVKVNDFGNIWSAWLTIDYYENLIRWERVTYDKCKSCKYHMGKICQGGCLGYKIISGEYVDQRKYQEALAVLPKNYLVRLGKAYRLFFTNRMQESWEILEKLNLEYQYEKTLWLRAIVSTCLKQETMMDCIKDLIDNSSYAAVSAMEIGRMLVESGENAYCKMTLEYAFGIVNKKDVGYNKLLCGLIEIAKRGNNCADIYKYVRS